MPRTQYSHHADRYQSALFASLWVKAWGEQHPVKVAPFSSCTHALLRQLEEQSGLRPGEVLVDLGCGTGGVGLWLASRSQAKLIGVDRCGDATAIATDRAQGAEWELTQPVSFAVGDFSAAGLPDAAADAVVSIDACTAASDCTSMLSEVHRILRPGGTFLFTARQLAPDSRHVAAVGPDWTPDWSTPASGSPPERCDRRCPVCGSAYTVSGWNTKRGCAVKLRAETVDGLVNEARQGMRKMEEARPWYLIRAVAAPRR